MNLMSPNPMRIGVLSAALQDVFTRAEQEADPIGIAQKSALWWIEQARTLKIDLQLSGALHVLDSHVPPESMLDPVAAHVALRTQSATDGVDLSDDHAAELIAACGQDVRICDIGYFDDLLHTDLDIRAKIHAHLIRNARAAVKLKPVGCGGVTTFVGRNTNLDDDQNVALFEEVVIPILKEFKALGLKLWIENCPMPGWNTKGLFVNNIAYCAGMWIKLIRVAEKHGVGDVLCITYDESHDTLMGNTHKGSFRSMRAAGLHKNMNRFHGKPNHRNRAKTALWSIRGQQIDLGCRMNGEPVDDPKARLGAWGVLTSDHGMIGFTLHNLLSMLLGYEPDWLDHQIEARSVLEVDPTDTVFILEHEWQANRVQDKKRVIEMLTISVQYMRGVDAAADALYRAGQWAAKNELVLPGVADSLAEIPGLQALVDAIRA